MDINSDCADDCATSCPPPASSWVLPSHSQGLGDTFIPKSKLCSQDEPRAQTWMQPWKIRHKKVSGIISTWALDLPCSAHWECHRKYVEFWGWISVLPIEERRTLPNSHLYVRQISKMEQPWLFGIQRIYHSSANTPWLLPALLNLFLLPAPSHHWMFTFLRAHACFQTH